MREREFVLGFDLFTRILVISRFWFDLFWFSFFIWIFIHKCEWKFADNNIDWAAENSTSPAIGSRGAKNRPLLGVWSRCFGAFDGNVCTNCSLVGVHMVCFQWFPAARKTYVEIVVLFDCPQKQKRIQIRRQKKRKEREREGGKKENKVCFVTVFHGQSNEKQFFNISFSVNSICFCYQIVVHFS